MAQISPRVMNVGETRGPCQRIMTHGNFAKCRARVTSNFVHRAQSCGSIVPPASFFFSSTEGKLSYATNTSKRAISSELSLPLSEFMSSNFIGLSATIYVWIIKTHPSTQWACAWRIVLCKLRLLCELYLFKVQFTRALKRSITPASHFRSTTHYIRSRTRIVDRIGWGLITTYYHISALDAET